MNQTHKLVIIIHCSQLKGAHLIQFNEYAKYLALLALGCLEVTLLT